MADHAASEEVLGEQYVTLFQLLRSLTTHTLPKAEHLAGIMAELDRKVRQTHVPPKAKPSWQTLQTFMAGDDSWLDKAARLSEQEVLMFLNALWDLYETTARVYYAVQPPREG